VRTGTSTVSYRTAYVKYSYHFQIAALSTQQAPTISRVKSEGKILIEMSFEGAVAVLLTTADDAIKAVSRLVLVLIFYGITEVAFPGFFEARRIQKSAPKFQHFRHELIHSVVTLIGGLFIAKLFKIGIGNGFIELLTLEDEQQQQQQQQQHNVSFIFCFLLRMFSEVAVYFLVFDGYFYFGHRLFHTKYLWFIHKHHHVSKSPNVMAGFSFNPLEGNLFGSFLPMYASALTCMFGGMLKASLITCGMIQLMQSLVIHCGYELVPAWYFESKLCSFFLTPTFHDRHHEQFNCNYSGFFTWLDDAFGTADGENWRANYAAWTRHHHRGREKKV
jgi:lathosterol oxidase